MRSLPGAGDPGGAHEQAQAPPANEPAVPRDDPQSDVAISLLLRGGVFAAAALLLAALAGSLLFGVPLRGHGASVGELWEGKAPLFEVIATLGILTLGITPVARVVLSIPIFARAGERSQAWIGVGVLALLALSAALGIVEG